MGVPRDGRGTHEMRKFSDFMTDSRAIFPHPPSMLRSGCALRKAAHSLARDSGGVRGFPAQHAQGASARIHQIAFQPFWESPKILSPLCWAKSRDSCSFHASRVHLGAGSFGPVFFLEFSQKGDFALVFTTTFSARGKHFARGRWENRFLVRAKRRASPEMEPPAHFWKKKMQRKRCI